MALGLVVLSSAPGPTTIRRWRENPKQFVWDNFHAEPDPWQGEVLDAFANGAISRISLQACAGPGKSTALAWCGWNFLSCYGDIGDHPKGAATSVTHQNLKDNLWAEYAKWQARSPYLSGAFTVHSDRIFANAHPLTWFLAARAWPKSASPDVQGKTLAGLHGRFVLAQIDESGDVPSTVARAAEQALSTGPEFGKVMQAGNPISLEGMLHEAATTRRHLWHVVRITGDPDDPTAWVHGARVREAKTPTGQTPLAWAREQIATYGRDNPWVMSYILGQFPPASINALLGLDEVEAAMRRHLPVTAYGHAQKRLGVDVARYGDDRTVIFPRQGIAAFKPVVMRHKRDAAVSVDIANQVMALKVRWGSHLEFFDATGGWAAGAVDVMRANGFTPYDIQFAAPAMDRTRYRNRRAELWFSMAQWVQRGAALPPLQELIGELVTPTYVFHNGVFQLEEKDQIKARLGRSPDLADALALTFGLTEQPAGLAHALGQAGTTQHDFDPFAPPARPVQRDWEPT